MTQSMSSINTEQTCKVKINEVKINAVKAPLLKVLVVEDSIAEQMRMKTIVIKHGYDVYCASNGQEALNLLAEEKIHLVISDWRMPELTGIELCRKLHNESKYGQPYFILLTGFNTQNDLIVGMDAGADDFISKPVSNEELRVRLQAGARVLNLRKTLEQQNQQLETALTREEEIRHGIQKDLNAAARMQRELLPDDTSAFHQIAIASLFKPAVTVAGDSYGHFKLDENHIAFYHLDVAGHGIASAMLSFTLSRFMSSALADGLLHEPIKSNKEEGELEPHIIPPHLVVSELNQKFQEKQDCSHYFTMVYGVFNVSTSHGTFCQAGHPHPMIISKNGSVQELGNGGFPVGMFDYVSYESTGFDLKDGDSLVLYSDGITDTTNSDDETFGLSRYKEFLSMSSRLPLSTTIESLDNILNQWKGNQNFDDDVSLLMLQKQPG